MEVNSENNLITYRNCLATVLLNKKQVADITDNIKELNPSFRSKLTGRFLYPSKRCFFTVAKQIKPKQAALEKTKTTRYTPSSEIKTAYILRT